MHRYEMFLDSDSSKKYPFIRGLLAAIPVRSIKVSDTHEPKDMESLGSQHPMVIHRSSMHSEFTMSMSMALLSPCGTVLHNLRPTVAKASDRVDQRLVCSVEEQVETVSDALASTSGTVGYVLTIIKTESLKIGESAHVTYLVHLSDLTG